jgi:hypothetical protein
MAVCCRQPEVVCLIFCRVVNKYLISYSSVNMDYYLNVIHVNGGMYEKILHISYSCRIYPVSRRL